MTWAVYGHGSWFAGHHDGDLDVLVVTEEALSREGAARRVAPLLEAPVGTALDVLVAHPDDLDARLRGLAGAGVLLDGDDVVAALPALRPFEWGQAMADELAERTAVGLPVALTALRALLAGEGRMVVRKADVAAACAGGPWESLAAAAWARRHEPAFDHPDLAAALRLAATGAAGLAALPGWERHGWSHHAHAAAVLTVYRRVLTADEVSRLVTVGTTAGQVGGWKKGAVAEPEVTAALGAVAVAANRYWWRLPLTGMEPPDIHRHGPGSIFPAHVDRLPMYPTRAFNVVAMIQPAGRGGQVWLDLGGERIEPELEPGDVVVFDSGHLHGVSEVEAGERVVLVSHVHMEVR